MFGFRIELCSGLYSETEHFCSGFYLKSNIFCSGFYSKSNIFVRGSIRNRTFLFEILVKNGQKFSILTIKMGKVENFCPFWTRLPNKNVRIRIESQTKMLGFRIESRTILFEILFENRTFLFEIIFEKWTSLLLFCPYL